MPCQASMPVANVRKRCAIPGTSRFAIGRTASRMALRLRVAQRVRVTQPLRRNRDFVLLWSGLVVSVVGTRLSTLGYPLLVLSMTHSPRAAGLVGFAAALPHIVFQLP